MEFAIATSGFSTPPSLHGKRGFVVGIANEASIAVGCARAFAAAGATLAATYLNDKAQPYVRAVTDPLGCKLLLPCDVRVPGQLEAAFLAWTHPHQSCQRHRPLRRTHRCRRLHGT